MFNNPIQFAVVREDPLIEASLVRADQCSQIAIIGSGGCTALTLQVLFPSLRITVVDPNSAQLKLIQKKMRVLHSGDPAQKKSLFNIENPDPTGFNQCGNFESLFRCFRGFLGEFVLSSEDWRQVFLDSEFRNEVLPSVFENEYWKVSFELHFADSFLRAMFGSQAVQHAPPGSYPEYFRKVFESGLSASAASHNYFLHHVFLGYYLDYPQCLPLYLVEKAPEFHLNFFQGTVDQVKSYAEFDLVSLSNIFDWMPESAVLETAELLGKKMKKGSVLVFRQLNHSKKFESYFSNGFDLDPVLADDLLSKDRSLFYSKLMIARKKQ